MATERRLKVWVNSASAGEIAPVQQGVVFTYKDINAPRVSLTMPVRVESWVSKNLHPVFQMNLPEGALKLALQEHFAKVTETDDLGLLSLIGTNMIGRIRVHESSRSSQLPSPLSLNEILFPPEKKYFEQIFARYFRVSGVSGVQPKILLQTVEKPSLATGEFIIKSYTEEYPHLSLNEYYCMTAVSAGGCPSPEFYLSSDKSMFIMRRFDLEENGSYLGFEDFCVLLGKSPSQKYQGSYEQIAKVTKATVSGEFQKTSLLEYCKAMAFNILLKNGDAHLKNFGVIYDDKMSYIKLAPFYDVVTTTVYLSEDIPALSFNGVKKWPSLKDFEKFARLSCLVSSSEFSEMIDKVTSAIKDTISKMELEISTSTESSAFLIKMKGIWQESLNEWRLI